MRAERFARFADSFGRFFSGYERCCIRYMGMRGTAGCTTRLVVVVSAMEWAEWVGSDIL